MSKLHSTIRLPAAYDRVPFQHILAKIDQQVNQLSDGRVVAVDNAATAAPTTGDCAVGDFVSNKTPTESGSPGSAYVVLGWICTAAGSPGTWLPCRALTGN